MVDSVSTSAGARLTMVDTGRAGPAGKADALAAGPSKAPVTSEPTKAAQLANLGPPIDANKVAAIMAAIANGNYTIDADRLARAMIALDLPAAK